jgi:hypothetical protein
MTKQMVVLALCMSVSGMAAEPDWQGVWTGTLKNFPARPDAQAVTVRREIGRLPQAGPADCTAFKTTYSESGVERGVKDYKLCRDKDAFYVDEGGGVRLAAQWLGDVLITPFKYDNLLLISILRLRGDVLEEEIYTMPDSESSKGVTPLTAKSLQRLELRRAPSR